MVSVSDLAAALGKGLLHPLVDGPREVVEVAVAEPGDRSADLRGHLVFGPAVTDGAAALELLRRVADGGAAGLVLRRAVARARGVRSAARRHRVALLELDDEAALAHVIELVRGVLDRAVASGLPEAQADPGTDLLGLADAAAGVVDAPVTIEDAQSRVLAYSSRHDVTDPARVSTIVGGRVPPELVNRLRSLGVFRRMARSDEPFLVPAGPGQALPRYVVPVRAGGEWLGSIWALVDEAPTADVVTELRRTANVVALHLLRSRAVTDLAQRLVTERVRQLLSTGTSHPAPEPAPESWLPAGPWRAVVLGGSPDAPAAPRDLDAWESRCRARGWRRPLLADLGPFVYALVTAAPDATARTPGSWPWLATLLDEAHGDRAVAGVLVGEPLDLPASARTASDLASLPAPAGSQPTVTAEDHWDRLTVSRAVGALAAGPVAALAGPVAVLAVHDERRRTAYLPSLAAWLDHPGEPTAAARALGVHVNTLRHRMVRMSEVTSLRLEDPTVRLALRLQLAARGL